MPSYSLRLHVVCWVLFVFSLSVSGQIYVDDSAVGANDGSSWYNAYNSLQDAIGAASAGQDIQIAQGIYYPDQGESVLPGDRYASFTLKDGLTLRGGFAGVTGANPSAWDPTVYETVLSGDLNRDSQDCFISLADNSYHIIVADHLEAKAYIEGLTICGGFANGGSTHNNGAGLFCYYSNVSVTDCIFRLNFSFSFGGAVYVGNGDCQLDHCLIENNKANAAGGALSVWYLSTLNSYYTIFRDNHSLAGSGAINLQSGSENNFYNCLIVGNSAIGSGGAIYNSNATSAMYNSIVYGNSAEVDSYNPSSGGGVYSRSGTFGIVNSIFYDNLTYTIYDHTSSYQSLSGSGISVSYSCIQNWSSTQNGNIADNPLFIDADGADNVIGTADDNYHFRVGSPCIDAGNTAAISSILIEDLDGQGRILNSAVDMGAYEGTRLGIVLDKNELFIAEGQSEEIGISLSQPPVYPVEVQVLRASGDPDIYVPTDNILYFTAENWAIPQAMSVMADPDEDHVNGVAQMMVYGSYYDSATMETVTIEGGFVATEQEEDVYEVLFVDSLATGHNDGSSWDNAFTDLSAAIAYSEIYTQFGEIRVAQGRYTPAGMNGARESAFVVCGDMKLRGGFAGLAGADPEEQDFELYPTILSGDLNGNDAQMTFHTLMEMITEPTRADNAYHVVDMTNSSAEASLEGFIIRDGNANAGGYEINNYGGVRCVCLKLT